MIVFIAKSKKSMTCLKLDKLRNDEDTF